MKILYTSRNYVYPLGGTEEFIYQTTNKIRAQKHQIEVATTTFRSEGKANHKSIIGRVSVKRFTISSYLLGYCYSRDLNNYLSKTHFDIAHAHGWGHHAVDATVKACSSRGKPVVITPHAFFHTERYAPIKSIYNILLGTRALKKAHLTALTKVQARRMMEMGTRNVSVIPDGVDIDSLRKSHSLREELALEGKILLCVGRLSRYKGFQDVIKALKIITEVHPNSILLIIGKDWGARHYLEELTHNLGITERVLFLGYLSREKLVAAFHDADVYICSSKVEGFGISTLEALACGKPVISTRTGVALDLEPEGRILTYNYGDYRVLTQHIFKIIEDEKLAEKLGRKGREIVEAEYTWDKVVDKLLKLYYKLIDI
jgi:glycosyltransferase involved in cell wall biosynthesis